MEVRKHSLRLRATNYKSFQYADIVLHPVNILIGANGAGKSNFLSLLSLIRHARNRELQLYVYHEGGADALLYRNNQTKAKQIELALDLMINGTTYCYQVQLSEHVSKIMVTRETIGAYDNNGKLNILEILTDSMSYECALPNYSQEKDSIGNIVYQFLHFSDVYHFLDIKSKVRSTQSIKFYRDYRLWGNGSNLTAYLYYLKEHHGDCYRRLIDIIRLAMPNFGDFYFRVSQALDFINCHLEWHPMNSDAILGPESLSDGILRFIALTAVLNCPEQECPSVILLEEPELGLHPYTLHLLAEMIKSASYRSHIVVTTQSPHLLNYFEPEDILVVDASEHGSIIRRLECDEVAHWLKEYTLGEIWDKNIIGGRP